MTDRVTCPACGEANRARARFCHRCGAELQQASEPLPMAAGEPADDAVVLELQDVNISQSVPADKVVALVEKRLRDDRLTGAPTPGYSRSTKSKDRSGPKLLAAEFKVSRQQMADRIEELIQQQMLVETVENKKYKFLEAGPLGLF